MLKRSHIILVVALAFVACLTPRVHAQTYDKSYAKALILPGGGTDASHTLTLSAPSLSSSYTLTLPSSITAGGLLSSDVNGNISLVSLSLGSLPIEPASTLLGNPTGLLGVTTSIPLGTGLGFTSLTTLSIVSPLPSTLTIPAPSITGAGSIGGSTTINTTGAITTSGGLTTSGGTANINSTFAGSPQNTNIDASPATGGTVTIGNSTSTITFVGGVTLPVGSVESFALHSATTNITSTTLAADPTLQLALAANATYEFSGVIAYDGAGSGGTVASTLNIAMHFATGTLTSMRWSANQAGTAMSPSSITTDGTAITSFHVDPVTAGNDQSIFISGVIVVGATGGTLEVEEALTSGTAATEILSNSFIRATRVQ